MESEEEEGNICARPPPSRYGEAMRESPAGPAQLRDQIEGAVKDTGDIRRRVEILTEAEGSAASAPLQQPPLPLVITQKAAATLKARFHD